MELLLKDGNAKQLSNWNFPLAQILEEYYTLLEKSENVNFGQGALLLQNAANVYARRVEYLWQETAILNESCEIADKKADDSRKEKANRKTKCAIDFNDFEPLKLENYIGKTINLKERNQKPVKLLSRRFTQLENNLSQLSSPIEILSVEGEVIGNKYDFRCNQQLTKNCMLVDELTTSDFPQDNPCTVDSEDQSADDVTINNTPQDSGFISTIEEPGSPELCNDDNVPGTSTSTDLPTSENTDDHINSSDDIDAGYNSGDTEAAQPESVSRKSKRTSNLMPVTSSLNKQVWEPIPFEHGIPDKIPRRRAEFKLPCDISLLRSRSRKRKIVPASKRQECLTRFFLDEYHHKKMKMYSPTRQFFTPLKKEEVEEFQKTFDECFKNMRGSEMYHYQAITSVTMDLLGFQRNFRKEDPLIGNMTFTTETSSDDSTPINESESRLSPVPSAFTPPPTPESDNHEINYKEIVEQQMRQITDNSTYSSKLEQRVAQWHRSLRPKLAAAECAPPFHIQEYGTQIMQRLEATKDNKIALRNLLQNQSSTEIARYFLASLQLANTYNVAINTSSESEAEIELTLLGREQPNKTIDAWEASSTTRPSKPGKPELYVRLERLSLLNDSNSCINSQQSTVNLISRKRAKTMN